MTIRIVDTDIASRTHTRSVGFIKLDTLDDTTVLIIASSTGWNFNKVRISSKGISLSRLFRGDSDQIDKLNNIIINILPNIIKAHNNGDEILIDGFIMCLMYEAIREGKKLPHIEVTDSLVELSAIAQYEIPTPNPDMEEFYEVYKGKSLLETVLKLNTASTKSARCQ